MNERYYSKSNECTEKGSASSTHTSDHYYYDDDYDCDDMMYNEGLCASCLYFNSNYCDSPDGLCAYEKR